MTVQKSGVWIPLSPYVFPMKPNSIISEILSYWKIIISATYFSSDKKGGKGGMDIWYVEEIRKKWSTPKNLGLKINTPGNEVGPFYHISTRSNFISLQIGIMDWEGMIFLK